MTKKKTVKKKLEIKTETSKQAAHITLVHFQGNLDADSIKTVADLFSKLLADRKLYIIAEMSCVKFISSPALGELMGCKSRLSAMNGSLVISGLEHENKVKMKLMGADKIFQFFPTIRSAINYLNWEFKRQSEYVEMQFPTNISFVPVVRRLISNIAIQKRYTRKDAFRIETIVDEICNNAIEHGDQQEGNTVKIRFTIDREKMDLQVINKTNQKNANELLEYAKKIQIDSENQFSDRGRGTFLVSKLVQNMNLDVSEDGTRVHVTKVRED